jgi:lysozyme
MPVPGFNGVVDLSHHNAVADWTALRRAGIAAVIHKATEGATFRDRTFRERRDRARAAGLLWGSYHFASGMPPAAQVANYLEWADPADDELIALDYEPSTAGATMTVFEMVEFVERIRAATGRIPVIYGGHLIREAAASIEGPEGAAARSILARCPLWYARYAPEPVGVPAIWPRWTLWQYTDGKAGPEPHAVAGLGPLDRDTFNGTEAELRAAWPL